VADREYPCGLPRPLSASISLTEFEHFRTNSVQAGPALYELMSDSVPTVFNVRFSYSRLQFQAFEAWFSSCIVYGVHEFDITLPVGSGDVIHECNFLESYSVSFNGRRVNVSAKLLAREKIYNTNADSDDLVLLMNFFEESGCQSECDVMNDFQTFESVTLPEAWGSMKLGTDFS